MEYEISYTTQIIIYIIKTFITNCFAWYVFEKILNTKISSVKQKIILIVTNVIITILSTYVEFYINSFLSGIILCLSFGAALGLLTKRKLGYSLIITIMAYAISLVSQGISVVIQFVPYKILDELFNVDNIYLSLVIISLIQFGLLYGFFKIKRFKNGFSFLNNKLNSEVADIIIINVATLVVLIYSLTGTYYDEITRNLFFTFVVIAITMFFTLQKMLTMYYRQKLLMDTLKQYEQELKEKQSEIDILKQDKKNVSKITHEFYNRQKALELLVANNMNADSINKENVSPNVLKIIESLTTEYSTRFEQIKQLPKLDKTDIQEIDNMFSYMQNECAKNNIEFKLKVVGNIYPLINNIITKNKLETLIGDHLRDAINAVNVSKLENKEIMVIIGVKNKKYELSIFDTGVDFEVDTLLKLGLEAVTTNAANGGTGTGFMTTFETLDETKASLIITEYPPNDGRFYTKCITIRFDSKKQYRINSYRAEQLKELSKDNRIKIEE